MSTLTELSRRLNSTGPDGTQIPTLILMTDDDRLPDPLAAVARLPKGAAVIVRARTPERREALSRQILPIARARGVKVLVAGDIRLALRLKLDGVHLSEHTARRGPLRVRAHKPGFLVTAAAHDGAALRRAGRAGADAALLSPLLTTASHPARRALGFLRFQRLLRTAPLAVIALGGVTPQALKRLALGPVHGIAAIGALS